MLGPELTMAQVTVLDILLIKLAKYKWLILKS